MVDSLAVADKTDEVSRTKGSSSDPRVKGAVRPALSGEAPGVSHPRPVGASLGVRVSA